MRGMIFALVFSVFVTACAANPEGAADVGRQDVTKVQVTNNNWLDMTIFAYRGTLRTRLGRVTSYNTEMFVLPRSLAGAEGIRLVARPLASSGSFVTEELSVFPGQTIELKIENHLATSSYSIW